MKPLDAEMVAIWRSIDGFFLVLTTLTQQAIAEHGPQAAYIINAYVSQSLARNFPAEDAPPEALRLLQRIREIGDANERRFDAEEAAARKAGAH